MTHDIVSTIECRRVAMLAVAGILLTEAAGLGPWWTAPFRVRPLGCLTLHRAMLKASELFRSASCFSLQQKTWLALEQRRRIFVIETLAKGLQQCSVRCSMTIVHA